MQVADKKLLITTNDPLLLQMSRITCLNVGESPRGRGAPRWFIFLSNRKKKKENTSLCVEIAPTPFPGYPRIRRRQGALWSLTVRHREAKRSASKLHSSSVFSYIISYDRAVYTWFMTTFSTERVLEERGCQICDVDHRGQSTSIPRTQGSNKEKE